MEIRNKLELWLEASGLEECLADNDLEPLDALLLLFDAGHIKLPVWLEDDDEEAEE